MNRWTRPLSGRSRTRHDRLPDTLGITVAKKKCPDCAEWVRDEARKCRYCGFEFQADMVPADYWPLAEFLEKALSTSGPEAAGSSPTFSETIDYHARALLSVVAGIHERDGSLVADYLGREPTRRRRHPKRALPLDKQPPDHDGPVRFVDAALDGVRFRTEPLYVLTDECLIYSQKQLRNRRVIWIHHADIVKVKVARKPLHRYSRLLVWERSFRGDAMKIEGKGTLFPNEKVDVFASYIRQRLETK